MKALLADVEAGRVDVIVVYKVDRLTRSLADFAKIVERLDSKEASFVSVTQAFNTTTSMGRLTLNVLLSFAQFEREVTGERKDLARPHHVMCSNSSWLHQSLPCINWQSGKDVAASNSPSCSGSVFSARESWR